MAFSLPISTAKEHDDKRPPPRKASTSSRRPHKSLTPETSFVFVNLQGERTRHKPNSKEIRSHVQLVTQEKRRRRQQKESNAVTKDGSVVPSYAPIRGVSWDQADPFDCLPAEGSPALREIIKYYSLAISGSQIARKNLNWDNTMWNLLRHDQLSFVVFLFGTTLVRDTIEGEGMSRQCYSYIHRTMQAVRTKLPDITDASSITDSFVVVVAGLTCATAAYGDYNASKSHLLGMLTLVATRGGLRTFGRFAQRTILWCEFNIRAALVSMPALRPIASTSVLFPPNLEERVDYLHQQTLTHFPGLVGSELGIIFRQLHLLSVAISPPWDVVVDRAAVSDTIDETEYCLLRELVRLKNEREQRGFTDWIYSTVAHVAQMYVWGVVSDVKAEMTMKREFTVELRDRLNVKDLRETWSQSASLQTLFWVLSVGLFLASRYRNCSDMIGWFENQIAELRNDNDPYLKLIKDFPGTEDFYREQSRLIESQGAIGRITEAFGL
ncbi:uncharacterized protein K452DRAFT_93176 [Aplosporella prunicola CBS 121167]|uniref:Transcription factor domain-containing protein n=1 Tax=Aplosporella prunicola CBS 121167 TaxID=1176127 RepID=A0A6A6B553_9PEZI|nr:uncharacterized protein K452DRAFT_93176 [Aplosporella prunicola CBS 121167]KAF2138405.1 hypothetical protein K452DRAFT_93176 [Aplosporella prunicola CBS 121167]